MPDASSRIPPELTEKLRDRVAEARVLLGVMRSLRSPSGGPGGMESRLYKVSASKFKRAASELAHRFDTMSHFVDGAALSSAASDLGCRWDPSSRRLVVP